MADFTDAVDREAAWFTDDLSANGIPPLLKQGSNGAPFAIVRARARQPSQRGQACFIWLERVVESRYALTRKLQVYHLVATCLWTRASDVGKTDVDEASFEAALAKVVQRVRGLKGDKTHGGRFLAAGEIDSGQITVDWPDAVNTLFANAFWRADVRWQAVDEFIGI